MKSERTYSIKNIEDQVEATLSITATLKEWRLLVEQTNGGVGNCYVVQVSNEIRQMLYEAERGLKLLAPKLHGAARIVLGGKKPQ